MDIEHIKKSIRNVPDFPKIGIQYKDITPLLKNHIIFDEVIDIFYNRYKDKNINAVIGIESRGFIFGAPLSLRLNCSFVPARKKGKLPFNNISAEYDLEYGKDSIEIHEDSINAGDNIIIIDDVIATGGTAGAVVELITKLNGNIIELGFLIELSSLIDKKNIRKNEYYSIVKYD